MTVVNALDARAYVNGKDVSGDLNELSPDLSSDVRDVTTFGPAPYAAKVAATRQLAAFQFRGFYSDDQLASVNAILDPLLGQAAAVTLWPAGPAAGNAGWGSAAALLTRWKVTSRVAEVVGASAEWDAGAAGAAAAERLVSLSTPSQLTGTGVMTLADVDNGALTAGAGAVYFQVLATDTPSGLTLLRAEHSPDGTTWTTLASAGLAAAGFARVAAAGPIQRHARVAFTLAAGKHLTLQVGLYRS